MRINERIEVSFLLLNELVEDLPRTFNDLHLAVRLGLTDEMDHFCHDNTNLVPLKVQICSLEGFQRDAPVSGGKGGSLPGSRRNVREPPAVLIHATLNADSILFIFQRWLNILR